MFKVLVIAYHFPPLGFSSVQRTLKFVRYMPKYNWEPTVITTGDAGYYSPDLSSLKEAENLGIRIIRTEENRNKPGQVLKPKKLPPELMRKLGSRISKTLIIPDNKKNWANRAYKAAKELLSKENFDIIYVSIPPFSAFSIAAKLSKEFDISLFVDYRDLWSGNQFAFNLTPYHKYLHKKREYQALKVADKVITINRKIKEHLLKRFKFLTFEDVVILPHGHDPEDFENVAPIPKMNNKLRLTYAGTFQEYITPKYLLRAFKKLAYERPDVAENIELHFLGPFSKEYLRLVHKLGLESYVKTYGVLDHKETVRRIVSSDVLWLMVGNHLNSDTVSTGKLYEYFAARKPVLACLPEGAAKTACQEYGAAFITDAEDIEQIKNALLNIHKLYREGKLPKPNEEFIERHRKDALTEQLTKSFQFYLREV